MSSEIENKKHKIENSIVDLTNYLVKRFVVFSLILMLIAPVFSLPLLINKSDDGGYYNPVNVSKPVAKIPEIEEPFDFTLVKSSFSASSNKTQNEITPSVPYEKISISDIDNLKAFEEDEEITLSEEQIEALEEYGFFITENNIIEDQSTYKSQDDFTDLYDVFNGYYSEYDREQSDAIFISTDTALHLYHILIDRSFQSIEEKKFQPTLREMTRELFRDSVEKYNEAEDEDVKESYKFLSVYYLIPLVVLDAGSNSAGVNLDPSNYKTYALYLEAVEKEQIANSEGDFVFSLERGECDGIEISEEIYELANKELNLILGAGGIGPSPLFTPLRIEFDNDYSQFKPRSHYTKNDVLKSYFIAMMWYGRMGFTLKNPELTRNAILMTAQINDLKVGEKNMSDLWSDMMEVIEFFVGEVDDLTAYEYTEVMESVYDEDLSLEENIFSDKFLDNFTDMAKKKLPSPKIISEAVWLFDDMENRDEFLSSLKQFRFMPQRFTPDAYIINNLTQGIGDPDPETGQNLPTMPTALMPMRVIAPQNEIVESYLDEWINDPDRISEQERESDKIIAKKLAILDEEFSAYEDEVWQQNIYWTWLDIFRTLLDKYDEGYPYFMQNENWQRKNLGTVLGSYTELKHDTLLYAKQSYAEMGGGADDKKEIPPVVKGYVEPDLEFWNKITQLAKKTKIGLEERNVFPEEFSYKYDAFIEFSEFCEDISEKELKNEKISDDEFEKLRSYIVRTMGYVTSPIGGDLTQKDKRAGIIADIHTDAIEKQILYESTGKPYIIYVAVKDINGTRLTRGAVYSHFEFTAGIDGRLTDEDWQAVVYEEKGEMPEGDKWSLELLK